MVIDLATIDFAPGQGGGGQKPEETFYVVPSIDGQYIFPQAGYVFSEGYVQNVTNSIDSNIITENIKSGVSILGVEGTYPSLSRTITANGDYDLSDYSSVAVSVPSEAKPEEVCYVTPSTSAQSLSPQAGYAFSSVEVSAVDATIDSNIVAENIKSGVEILGVIGNFIGEGDGTANHPYTVRQIRKLLDDTPSHSVYNVFVAGVVSSITQSYSQSGTYGNATFDIIDIDGDSSNSFKIYRGLYYYGNKYTAYPSGGYPDVERGDWIIVCGNAYIHQNTYEFRGNTGQIFYLKNPVYTPVQVDYRNRTGIVNKLDQIGWSEEDILYANANLLHYGWQNSDYEVDAANIALYGVVDASNISTYKNDTTMKFVPKFDTSSVTDFEDYFSTFRNIVGVYKLDRTSLTNKSVHSMFGACNRLESVELFDTQDITDFGSMFSYCYRLGSVPEFSTAAAEHIDYMFNDCHRLSSAPEIDMRYVTTADGLFSGCWNLTSVRFKNTDSGLLTTADSMFRDCKSLESVPSSLTQLIANVTDCDHMFDGCSKLTYIPELYTSNVTTMDGMFWGCFDEQPLADAPLGDCTIANIDFSGLTSFPLNFFRDGGTYVKEIRVSGSINFSWTAANGFERLVNISYDSLKSILTAMDNCTNPETTKMMQFNITMTDQGGELAALVTSCSGKGWIITGLTIV